MGLDAEPLFFQDGMLSDFVHNCNRMIPSTTNKASYYVGWTFYNLIVQCDLASTAESRNFRFPLKSRPTAISSYQVCSCDGDVKIDEISCENAVA